MGPGFSSGLLEDALRALRMQAPQLAVLCLGLGSPCGSRDARAQLAWLLDACDRLSIVCNFLFSFCVRTLANKDPSPRVHVAPAITRGPASASAILGAFAHFRV